MPTADYRLATDTTLERVATALEAFNPTPFVVSIPAGQWSGSGSDYYISIAASNVTANSILLPHYDQASAELLNGPVWCVPAAGSFTIHTTAIPSGTVTILVQFVGTLGEAQYQVLADVYSKAQVDEKIGLLNTTKVSILYSSVIWYSAYDIDVPHENGMFMIFSTNGEIITGVAYQNGTSGRVGPNSSSYVNIDTVTVANHIMHITMKRDAGVVVLWVS